MHFLSRNFRGMPIVGSGLVWDLNMFLAAERRKSLATADRGCCRNAEFRNFPLLFEEGWTRPQQDIAKPPFWSGRSGDQIPQKFIEVEHIIPREARLSGRVVMRVLWAKGRRVWPRPATPTAQERT